MLIGRRSSAGFGVHDVGKRQALGIPAPHLAKGAANRFRQQAVRR
jgi:hypothetical protein